MLLSVTPCIFAPGATQITWIVPGHQTWYPRTFRGTVDRDTGGAPDRSYALVVTDGSSVVTYAPAGDAGDEPGLCTITWAQCPAASVSSGAVGISVAPIGPLTLPAGYNVSLVINSAVGADRWLDAVAWYDFRYDTPPGIE